MVLYDQSSEPEGTQGTQGTQGVLGVLSQGTHRMFLYDQSSEPEGTETHTSFSTESHRRVLPAQGGCG